MVTTTARHLRRHARHLHAASATFTAAFATFTAASATFTAASAASRHLHRVRRDHPLRRARHLHHVRRVRPLRRHVRRRTSAGATSAGAPFTAASTATLATGSGTRHGGHHLAEALLQFFRAEKSVSIGIQLLHFGDAGFQLFDGQFAILVRIEHADEQIRHHVAATPASSTRPTLAWTPLAWTPLATSAATFLLPAAFLPAASFIFLGLQPIYRQGQTQTRHQYCS